MLLILLISYVLQGGSGVVQAPSQQIQGTQFNGLFQLQGSNVDLQPANYRLQ